MRSLFSGGIKMRKILFLVFLIPVPVCFADIVFETAPQPVYSFVGGQGFGTTGWVAEPFTLTQATLITDVGGAFTNGDGSKLLFAAIVNDPLPSHNLSWYKTNISTIALADATFGLPTSNPPGGIIDVPMSVTL